MTTELARPLTSSGRPPAGEDRPDLFGGRPTVELSRAVLRQGRPVSQDPATGLWLLTREADVRAVLADPGTFRPDNALTAITPLSAAALRVLATAGVALPAVLANNGDADHADLRRLVARFLTPRAVAAAIPEIRRLAQHGAAAVRTALDHHHEADLVALVAAELPARVLMYLLGFGRDDIEARAGMLVRWSAAALELFWGRPDEPRQLALAAEVAELYRWIAGRLETAPDGGADLFTVVNSHRDPAGRPLGRHQAASLCFFLLVAGQQTTSQLLATALRRLIGDPDLWPRLGRAGGGPLVDSCVDGVLAVEPPVTTWRRVLSRPATVAGVPLPAGAELLLMLAACGIGNGPSPDRNSAEAIPARAIRPGLLAFGAGPHACPGANLARAEAAIVIATLARELPDLRLRKDDPPHLQLLSFNAPARVLIETA